MSKTIEVLEELRLACNGMGHTTRTAALDIVIAAMKAKSDGVVCPFCQEDGFDLIGLKHHLLSCEEMAKTEAANFVRTRPAAALEKEKS